MDAAPAVPQSPKTLNASIVISTADLLQLRSYENELELAKEAFPAVFPLPPEVADMAGSELIRLRSRFKEIDEKRKKYISPAQQIIDQANADHQPALKSIKAADEYIADVLSQDQVARKRIADEARRRQEEEARAARAIEEKKAAEERARAEAEARARAEESRRLAEEAERDKTNAEALARSEAAKIVAENAASTAEAAAQSSLELSTMPIAMPAPVTARKVAGLDMRDHWVAELDGDEESAKRKLIEGAVGTQMLGFVRPDLLALLTIDMVAANRLAAGLKQALNVPGLIARNVPVPAKSRGSK
jgi:DNA repair exonuclease SbcCD ATPase subunit